MKTRYECGICRTLSIADIFATPPVRPLPPELLPAGVDVRWSYVRVHVCEVCRNHCARWFQRHKATHFDMRLAKPVKGTAAGVKPWRIPAEHVPDLYAALLIATVSERNAYLQCWQAPAKPRKGKA